MRFLNPKTDFIELVFVELPKFAKSLDELTTLSDRWIYFLKQAESLERSKTRLSVPVIESIVNI
ncbi:hypothetical protein BH23CYA1_BH23CYA1_03070 [soil metagenome]